MDQSDLDNRFSYHPPSAARGERHREARESCLALAHEINGSVPEGREKSSAVTNLELVMFWWNAAIARQPRDEL